jgi:Asp-tRNA(Asn)/Glu-tRNA(Gln) amidotransferase C subunit
MTNASTFAREQVQALARMNDLDLPPERLDALTRAFSEMMERFRHVRDIDTGESEPPTISYDDQVAAR